jgi:ubiquinone/menaquinone biosynthesis C-methylase UbiE
MSESREQDLRQLWDDSAYQYYKYVQRFRTHRGITSALISAMTSDPERILDFGCGPGNSTALLSKCFPGAQLIGLDWSRAMIKIAEEVARPADNISFLCGEIGELASELADFDVVTCNNSFFHVEDKGRLLADMHRLMRSGGKLAFTMYDSVFRPADDMTWPYAAHATDDLMQVVLDSLRHEGYPLLSRKEEREVMTEHGMAELFTSHGFKVWCSGVLRLRRTPQERLAFFGIPSVAQEVFPDVPYEVLAGVLRRIRCTHASVQERNVYVFTAERLDG